MCNVLNYCKHFLVLVSAVSGCVSISALASLVCVSVGIASFAVGSKICVITVLLAKTNVNTIEVLISKAVIDCCINHEGFV